MRPSFTPRPRPAAVAAAVALAATTLTYAVTPLPTQPPVCLVLVPNRSWKAPLLLQDSAVVGELQLAVSANGSAVLVWLELLAPGRYAVQSLRYIDGFPSGNWDRLPTTLGTYTVAQEPDLASVSPRVAMDSKGNATVVWTAPVDAQTTRIHGRHLRFGSWGSEWAADPGPTLKGRDYLADSARVAINDGGTGLVLWSLRVAGQAAAAVLQAASFDAVTGNWSAPRAVSSKDPGAYATAPSLTMDDKGAAIALWEQPVQYTVGAGRYDPAAGWGAPVSGPNLINEGLSSSVISHDANGRAVAGWLSRRLVQPLGYPSLQLAALNPSTLPLRLTSTLVEGFTNPTSMALGVDAKGDAVMVWNHSLAPGYANGVSARVLTAGGVLSPAASAAATRLDAGDAEATAVGVGMDRDGNATAVWLQSDGSAPSVVVNQMLHVPPGNGACPEWFWGQPHAIEGHATEAAGPLLRVYPYGAALVVWQEPRPGPGAIRSIYAAFYR